MYKLLIADDEEFSRNSLKKAIKWEDFDIRIVGEAEDGFEAVSLFEELRPHIVLMDINMPFKDGLEVSQHLLRIDRDVQIIIITGFPDLENARKSIKLGIVDFVSKPVDRDEMNKAIGKACDALDNLRKNRINSEKLELLLDESMPILKEKFLNELLLGNKAISPDYIEERLHYLNIDLLNGIYGIAIIVPELNEAIVAKENDALFISMKNIMEELFCEYIIKNVVYPDSLNRFIIIYSCADRSIYTNIDNIFIKIRDKIKFYLNVDLYAGIGSEESSLSGMKESFESACHALNYVNIYGRNNVVNAANINRLEKSKTVYSGKDLDYLISSFNAGNKTEYFNRFNILTNRIVVDSFGNIKCLKRMLLELLTMLLRFCSDMSIDVDSYLMNRDPYAILLSFNNVLTLKEWMINTSNELLDLIGIKRKEKTNRIIETAKSYIQENHRNSELTLKTVSEYVELSTIYFCKLFHQETNLHFNEYLNQIRIDNAKKLLTTSMMKVYEIAYETGYSDPKHFIVTFKKFTGRTPNDYRKTH